MSRANVNTGVIAITPSDTTVLPGDIERLYVGTTGNVNLRMADGTYGLLVAVPAGTQVVCSPSQVLFTGTTASNIVAFRSGPG